MMGEEGQAKKVEKDEKEKGGEGKGEGKEKGGRDDLCFGLLLGLAIQ